MKNIILILSLLTGTSSFADTMVNCNTNAGSFTLNLSSLSAQPGQCQSGVFGSSNPAIHRVVRYCDSTPQTLTGVTEAQNAAGEWIALGSFATGTNCIIYGSVEVGCPGGLMTNCSNPGGHGNSGHGGGFNPGHGGHF